MYFFIGNIQFLGSHAGVGTREKLFMCHLLLGVRTDVISESSYGNISAHKKFQFKTPKLVISCRSQYASRMTGMHN